jgi:ADP-ribose pyrophosphatase YjhB (NUDIX family)
MKKYKSENEFLKNYDESQYKSPSVTVDTLVFTIGDKKNNNYRKLSSKSLQILLVKRKEFPEKDKWAIPGGFMNVEETIIEAANRRLKEEVGLENVYLEQLYTWGDLDRDPRKRILSASYLSLVNKDNVTIHSGETAWEAGWFDISFNELSKETIDDFQKINMELILTHSETLEKLKINILITKSIKNHLIDVNTEVIGDKILAFDHAKIIAYAITRLRNKLEYSSIAVHLMPEAFTFGDLQSVYECILNKELLGPNFRRKMKPLLSEVNDIVKDNSGHRPAQLFKFNNEIILNEL